MEKVVDNDEINRLLGVIRGKDEEIRVLLNRPREKEIVVETHEVMDHKEVNRLTNLLHERDEEIHRLRNLPR